MGTSYTRQDYDFARERRDERDAINKARMGLANKIVMACVDKICSEIIRPGPNPEERECYVMADELRSLSPGLTALVKDILKIDAAEG